MAIFTGSTPPLTPAGSPPMQARIDPTDAKTQSILSRLKFISAFTWIGFTLMGLLCGIAHAYAGVRAIDQTYFGDSLMIMAAIEAVTGAAIGSFIGYLISVVFDWARQILVVLDRIAPARETDPQP